MATKTCSRSMGLVVMLVLAGCATAFEDEGAGSGHDALSSAAADCAEREARGERCEDPTATDPGATDPADDGDHPAPAPGATDSSIGPAPGPLAICGREVRSGAECADDGTRSCSREDGTRCECVEAARPDGTTGILWKCEVDPPPPPPPPPFPAMCPPGVDPGAPGRVECREPRALCNIGDFWCECVEDDLRDPPFPVYYWRCPSPPPPPVPVCPEGVFPGSDRDVLCSDADDVCVTPDATCRCVEDGSDRAGVRRWTCDRADPPAPVPADAAD